MTYRMRTALLVIPALLLPTILSWVYFVAPWDTSGGQMNPMRQALYTVGKWLLLAYPLICARILDGWLPRLRPPSRRGLMVGLLFGTFVMFGTFALYFFFLRNTSVFGDTPENLRVKLREFGIDTFPRFLFFGLFVSLIHSLLEEYYWRWFVFRRLRDLMPLFPAMIVSALGFMGNHILILQVYFPDRFFLAVLPFSLCVGVGGAFWAWLYERTGSLTACWASHLLVDVALFVVGYDLVFR